ncbi:hypothetical protein CVT26_011890 [Gymnopilus dilepis]|uniref:NAD(P)-binding domain-containing protein n=1 Tax=Gymnopilus dilepis TaxID=231916 RepID=A0A409W5I4_9AGAR|nr:hypothetical protein CVT26_011890 [Gymnopilus dilepis]
MKVLVLGASGFIGFPAAQALLIHRAVIPLVADVASPSQWIEIVKDLDAVIDCVGGDIKSLGEVIFTAVREAAQKHRPQGAPKLTYVYTSGGWVHGDSRNDIVTDTTPITKPVDLVAWRPEHERRVAHDATLNGFVIRPAGVYGRSGSIFAPFFKSASEGKVRFPGTPGGRLAVLHTDDLADLYVKATEKAVLCGGLIIDGANDTTESTDDFLRALVKVSGASGPYEYTEPANLFEVALGTTVLLRAYLAKSLLGWQPPCARMKVLILGYSDPFARNSLRFLIVFYRASGYIGFPAAQALVRAGHYVIGQTRSAEKGKLLAVEEIIPLVGEITKPSEWVDIVKDLDAVIDCIGGTPEIKLLADITLTAISEAAKNLRPKGAPKLTFIYTSGVWVHSDNRNDIVTDTTPITKPIDLVTWRPAHEQRVIHDPNINGFVIRPALLYGRSGSLFAPFFKSASEGRVWYPGTPGGRLAVLHTDDLSDLYVKATEKAVLCGGLIIDAANDNTESTDDFLAALVKVSKANGDYEYREPTNVFEVALGTTILLRPYLAKALLGWQPRKPGLIDGLQVYYGAWKAYQTASNKIVMQYDKDPYSRT